MSRTRGEGRAPNEKSGRLIDPDYTRRRRAKLKAEQTRWDSLAGPVEVRKVENSGNEEGNV